MSCRKLPDHLRSHRKRAGFSQEEIAFLLGRHTAGQASRYEHFRCIPCLHTALAYHIIFQSSPRELFKGDYETVERSVGQRANRLAQDLDTDHPDPLIIRKLTRLKIIAAMPSASRLS